MTKEAAVIIAFLRSRLICPTRANQGCCHRGPVAKSFPAKPMARLAISDFRKWRLRSNPNQLYVSTVPPPLEGRFAIVTDVGGGMRWTLMVLLTRAPLGGRQSRVVLTPRRRRQVCGGNSASDGDNKADLRGEHEISRKPLRREGRVNPVDLWCAFYHCTRGCGCIVRPAFPAPSAFRGANDQARLARNHAARSRSHARSSPLLPLRRGRGDSEGFLFGN